MFCWRMGMLASCAWRRMYSECFGRILGANIWQPSTLLKTHRLIIDMLCNCLFFRDALKTLCRVGMKALTSRWLCAPHSAAASVADVGAAVSVVAAAAAFCRSVQAWVLPPC